MPPRLILWCHAVRLWARTKSRTGQTRMTCILHIRLVRGPPHAGVCGTDPVGWCQEKLESRTGRKSPLPPNTLIREADDEPTAERGAVRGTAIPRQPPAAQRTQASRGGNSRLE